MNATPTRGRLPIAGTAIVATAIPVSDTWRVTHRHTGEVLGYVNPTPQDDGWIVEGHEGRHDTLEAAARSLVTPAETEDRTAQRRELAAVIAGQAQAIADGQVAVESAAVARLLDNVQTLRAWTPQP